MTMTARPLPHRLFGLGVVATSPAAMELLAQHNVRATSFLERHTYGDWPDMLPSEIRSNIAALHAGTCSIIGRYDIGAAERIVVITDPESLTLLVTSAQAATILRTAPGAREVSLCRWTPALVCS